MDSARGPIAIAFTIVLSMFAVGAARAAERVPDRQWSPAERGYWLLLNKPYLPTEFTGEMFESLWTVWPAEWKARAESASPAERRQMAYRRYGFIDAPQEGRSTPLGYVDDGQGGWVMNCLACHGGKVAGQVVPGVGNTHFAFSTLVEDVVKLRLAQRESVSLDELSRMSTPLGRSNGTTNAQTFSVALVALRDDDMNFDGKRPLPPLVHHDLDAPPLWTTKKKRQLYIDGFVEKTHRTIMQFVLVPSNDAATIKSWEDDFRDILAWIESLEPPSYPWPIDHELAEQGRAVFNQACADCHGTYGPGGEYPELTIDIDVVGTDPLRLQGIPAEHRRFFSRGWMGEGGTQVVESPAGYVAPPLDGIWASAPYLHNGSVPTLWHLFHPDERPVVWQRTEDGYDRERIGLEVEVFDELPSTARSRDAKRTFYDTRLPGKSAAGHEFPDQLNDDQKRSVLEYLKTL